MHPHNRHREPHDFQALADAWPALRPFMTPNESGKLIMDFSDPEGVRCFSEALLAIHYQVAPWHLPPGNLCPPVPGRADYLLHLNDLLRESPVTPPRGYPKTWDLLDIGTGASGIFPVLAARLFQWTSVGSEMNPDSIQALRDNLAHHPDLTPLIHLREQPDARAIFRHIVAPGEYFRAALCNPPFYPSEQAAEKANQRRWNQPGRAFGGLGHELWCAGGEVAFIRRMIDESRAYAGQVGWFTCLVSRGGNLRQLEVHCRRAGARDVHVVAMTQGKKQRRFIAWRFHVH